MITFLTAKPQALKNAFDKAIKDGHITTWADDGDGWYSHKAPNWKGKAFLAPSIDTAVALKFKILIMDSVKISDRRVVYSYYHGHLIETFINHFSSMCDVGQATLNPSGSDSKV